MRLIFMALLLFYITSCKTGSDSTSLLDDPVSVENDAWTNTAYEARFRMLASLSAWYPGMNSPGPHGLWAGMYRQTKWQVETHRAELDIWNLPNASLTVLPYQVASDLRRDVDYCRDFRSSRWSEETQMAASRACYSWRSYFLAHGNAATAMRQSEMQQILWVAHTASLRFVMLAFADRLGPGTLYFEEFRFWRGWVRFVEALDEANFTTVDRVVSAINRHFLPDCGPFGGSMDCTVDQLPKMTQRKMAYYLMSESQLMDPVVGWLNTALRPFL